MDPRMRLSPSGAARRVAAAFRRSVGRLLLGLGLLLAAAGLLLAGSRYLAERRLPAGSRAGTAAAVVRSATKAACSPCKRTSHCPGLRPTRLRTS